MGIFRVWELRPVADARKAAAEGRTRGAAATGVRRLSARRGTLSPGGGTRLRRACGATKRVLHWHPRREREGERCRTRGVAHGQGP